MISIFQMRNLGLEEMVLPEVTTGWDLNSDLTLSHEDGL